MQILHFLHKILEIISQRKSQTPTFEIFLHKFVSLCCHLFSSFGFHHVFQLEKFFVEMINCRVFLVFHVFRFAQVCGRLDFWVVKRSFCVAAVAECASDSNCADGIETICILNNVQFFEGFFWS